MIPRSHSAFAASEYLLRSTMICAIIWYWPIKLYATSYAVGLLFYLYDGIISIIFCIILMLYRADYECYIYSLLSFKNCIFTLYSYEVSNPVNLSSAFSIISLGYGLILQAISQNNLHALRLAFVILWQNWVSLLTHSISCRINLSGAMLLVNLSIKSAISSFLNLMDTLSSYL